MPERHRTSSIFAKSIPELQRWAAQERLDHRKLNKPVEAINAMVRGVAGPHQPPMVARGDTVSAEPAITVVLVEAPSLPDPEVPGSSILKVRRIGYANPPVPEQYVWDGEAFDAYPTFGATVQDFVGLEWNPATGVPDVDRATFLKARLVGGSWLVDRPAALVAQFQLFQVRDDYLLARLFDGETAGVVLTKIAKPYLLRVSTFDRKTRDGIIYHVDDNDSGKRTARKLSTGDIETQIVIPSYGPFVDGKGTIVPVIIYATAHVKGGIDVSSGVPPKPLLWLDDNRDSRAWAAEFEEEAASA